MKRLYIILIALVAAGVCLFHSCKTNEENYRRAYETASQRQNAAYTSDEIELMAAEEAIPRTLYRGDSIPLKGMWVNTVKIDSTTQRARRYNVVIGRYRQKFTAMSLLDRVKSQGYPGAVLLIDKEQAFYVAPLTTDTLDRAVEAWRQIGANPPVMLHSPFPYILRRP